MAINAESEPAMLAVKIDKRSIEAIDIVSLKLVSASAEPLPEFSAGAHVELAIKPGLRRAYSLCNTPGNPPYYEIAVLKDPQSRGGSMAIHDGFREGDVIHISSPKNLFSLDHSAKSSILLAGGIGITPIMAMAEELYAAGRDFVLHYCARARTRAAFVDRLRGAPYAQQVRLHFDDEPTTALDIKGALGDADPVKHLYVCGPEGFLEHVRNSARAANWTEPTVHYEYFGAKPVASPFGDGTFEIKIASSGMIIEVHEGKTAIAALGENGIAIPMSCEQGVCGTCVVGIVDGVPDHRDHFLTNSERDSNKKFVPCVSRCKSGCLTLDL